MRTASIGHSGEKDAMQNPAVPETIAIIDHSFEIGSFTSHRWYSGSLCEMLERNADEVIGQCQIIVLDRCGRALHWFSFEERHTCPPDRELVRLVEEGARYMAYRAAADVLSPREFATLGMAHAHGPFFEEGAQKAGVPIDIAETIIAQAQAKIAEEEERLRQFPKSLQIHSFETLRDLEFDLEWFSMAENYAGSWVILFDPLHQASYRQAGVVLELTRLIRAHDTILPLTHIATATHTRNDKQRVMGADQATRHQAPSKAVTKKNRMHHAAGWKQNAARALPPILMIAAILMATIMLSALTAWLGSADEALLARADDNMTFTTEEMVGRNLAQKEWVKARRDDMSKPGDHQRGRDDAPGEVGETP